MRTTLEIDNDILGAAKELAAREKKTAGKVISELARRGIQSHRGKPTKKFGTDSKFYRQTIALLPRNSCRKFSKNPAKRDRIARYQHAHRAVRRGACASQGGARMDDSEPVARLGDMPNYAKRMRSRDVATAVSRPDSRGRNRAPTVDSVSCPGAHLLARLDFPLRFQPLRVRSDPNAKDSYRCLFAGPCCGGGRAPRYAFDHDVPPSPFSCFRPASFSVFWYRFTPDKKLGRGDHPSLRDAPGFLNFKQLMVEPPSPKGCGVPRS